MRETEERAGTTGTRLGLRSGPIDFRTVRSDRRTGPARTGPPAGPAGPMVLVRSTYFFKSIFTNCHPVVLRRLRRWSNAD
jgi:hypothetical protein